MGAFYIACSVCGSAAMRHTFHTDDCRFPFLNAVWSHAAKDSCALSVKSGNNVRRTGERLRG